jgi:hypothetical protein
MEQQILRQIEDGEFAPHRDEAARMTPQEFAKKYGVSIRIWGNPATYWCVHVAGVDYLWHIASGVYDGWDFAVDAHPVESYKLQPRSGLQKAITAANVFWGHWKVGGLARAWLFTRRYWSNTDSATTSHHIYTNT